MESREKFGLSAMGFLIFSMYNIITSDTVLAIIGCLVAGVLIWFATFYKYSGKRLRGEREMLEDMVKIKRLREELGMPDKSDKGES